MTNKDIEIKKALGTFQPNQYLSNLSLAYFESGEFAARRLFPVLPVQLPAGKYFEFSRDDLARDNLQPKPPYGSVSPAVFSLSEKGYSTRLHQILIGLDQILDLPYQRMDSAWDYERIRAKTLTEQINLHLEQAFAKKFFRADSWKNVWQGGNSNNPAQKKFLKFTDKNSNPIELFDSLSTEIRRNGRVKPNKLALGMDAFVALKNNPNVQERVKYSGSTANPAVVNENVLAQLFGLEQVIALDTTHNTAKIGKEGEMDFIADSKAALLMHTPAAAGIDIPSAGFIFCWQISGSDYITVDRFEGAPGTHVDLLEGLISYDMCKTSDELAIFLSDCV